MSNQSETFGRLLRGAINSIAAYEGKTAPSVEDELGAQIGVTGASIQRYKGGAIPPEPRTVELLAEAGVRRGFLARAWLVRFLQAARYPTPEALLAQLADALGALVAAPAGGLPSGTVALLLTDIAGSTTRWEQQPRQMERDLARHDAILRQAIDSYGGQVFKTAGDAFFAVFTTAPAALEAALAAQRALHAEAWGPTGPLAVRMAVHAGAPQLRDGDYFGPPMNRAARILGVAHGGQVLLSNSAHELAHEQLPPQAGLRDLGEHRLKDLGRPERIFQLIAPDLPDDFPPLLSLGSYHHNLPLQATPLIGREAEVERVTDLLLHGGLRLLTLTGPGGVGKTRLALQAAGELLDAFPDGVWFVELAPISDPALVAGAIAIAFGLRDSGQRPVLDLLTRYLQNKDLLLILDNFEQVVAAAPVVSALLAAAPRLRVLATSRTALRLSGEQEYAVPPLELPQRTPPPAPERITQYEAVRLFIARATAVRADFSVSAANAPIIAEICQRLDGLPLAIELAAARCKLFAPQAILARLDKRLATLTGGPRDLPARQQTLRGAIDWSYDLLDAAEQALFARLAVFVGGCILEAAVAVAGDPASGADELAVYLDEEAVLAGVSSLVDKSLLQQREGAGGEPRLVMLETIREYALEQLEQSGESETLRRRHTVWLCALAETAHDQRVGDTLRAVTERLSAERENLRAALAWAEHAPDGAAPALQLVGALRWFWMNGMIAGMAMREGLTLLKTALRRREAAPLEIQAHALLGAGALATELGDAEDAVAYYTASLEIYRALDDRESVAGVLQYLGFQERMLGHLDVAETMLVESFAVLQALNLPYAAAWSLLGMGDTAFDMGDLALARARFGQVLAMGETNEIGECVAWARLCLGRVAHSEGQYDAAITQYEQALAFFRETSMAYGHVGVLVDLGDAYRLRGDLSRALACLDECLRLWVEMSAGSVHHLLVGLEAVAGLAAAGGQPEAAARLLGAADAALSRRGLRRWALASIQHEQIVGLVRPQLPAEAFAAAWQAGQALDLDGAVALAQRLCRVLAA